MALSTHLHILSNCTEHWK